MEDSYEAELLKGCHFCEPLNDEVGICLDCKERLEAYRKGKAEGIEIGRPVGIKIGKAQARKEVIDYIKKYESALPAFQFMKGLKQKLQGEGLK